MLVDETGETTITNDGATILKLLDVKHPAAKLLCQIADQQDYEVGDGTTSVVIFAAELLKVILNLLIIETNNLNFKKGAEELVRQKIHPNSVIAGYTLACKESVKYIRENLTIPVNEINRESIVNAAKVSLLYLWNQIIHSIQDLNELENHQHAFGLLRQSDCWRR